MIPVPFVSMSWPERISWKNIIANKIDAKWVGCCCSWRWHEILAANWHSASVTDVTIRNLFCRCIRLRLSKCHVIRYPFHVRGKLSVWQLIICKQNDRLTNLLESCRQSTVLWEPSGQVDFLGIQHRHTKSSSKNRLVYLISVNLTILQHSPLPSTVCLLFLHGDSHDHVMNWSTTD